MKLGVNIDHVATLRQARRGRDPEPILAARAAEVAGADSIVVHLREDRRHIQDRDVEALRRSVKTKLNLEMSIAPQIVEIACSVRPDQATLVPEKRQELTTEGGLDVAANLQKIKAAVASLRKRAITVSLFIDPDQPQIDASCVTGAEMIELHTGRFAEARSAAERRKYLDEIKAAVAYAASKGLIVNAGHGLDYKNVRQIARIKGIAELNIGYSIVCRAVMVGLERAVREMKALIK